MNRKNFINGRIAALFFYVAGCAVAITEGLINPGVITLPHEITSVFLIITIVILCLAHPGRRMKMRTYVELQCVFFLALSVIMGYVYGSIDIMLFLFFVQSFLMFIFLDAGLFLFQTIAMTLLWVAVIILGLCGWRFDRLTSAHIVGIVCLFFTHRLCVLIIRLFAVQTRNIAEQERGIDDLMELLETKCSEARKAAKSKTDFLSNMSHEIRTPINSVLGMNEMILRETDNEEIKKYADNIYKSGQVLLSLINDILDMSKIESGKMEIIPTTYNTSSFIHDLVIMTQMRAQEKKLRLLLDIDENLPSVLYGDDVRIRQILINLLTNAVKYTNEGNVTLKISGEKTEEEYGYRLHCEVRDTGIGIRKENIPQLFAAFERIEEKRNRNIMGTGLGLAITEQILQMMESHLEVESEYGRGSVFSFDVMQEIVEDEPIGRFQDTLGKIAMDHHDYQVSVYAPDARILLVDDNEINRKVFCNLLKQTGVRIKSVESGRKCLELIQKEAFDLIFLDHMMPGMDGIETLHHIREKENPCRSTPVIVLTANAISGARDRYMQEGFDDFLSKPIAPGKLEGIVREWLPQELLKEIPKKWQSTGTADKEAESALIELPEIEGIYWDYAMMHFPDEEMLLQTVKEFCQINRSTADKLENMFRHIREDGMLEEYQVLVHAMKSSLALIGAMPLSGCAKLLEDAAGRSHVELIEVLTPVFLDDWRECRERLSVIVQIEGEADDSEKEKDDQIVLALLKLLCEAAETMDLDTMDDCVDKLEGYRMPEDSEDACSELRTAVTELDTERILALSDKIANDVRIQLRSEDE